jgi:hypothetical protein
MDDEDGTRKIILPVVGILFVIAVLILIVSYYFVYSLSKEWY